MRPGFVFVGLFAALITTYVLLEGRVGSWMTFTLQAVIVIVLLAAATWFRRRRAAQRGRRVRRSAGQDGARP